MLDGWKAERRVGMEERKKNEVRNFVLIAP
jgi:hypothetical protein